MSNSIVRFFLVVFVVSFQGVAFGKDYYVSTSGNDGNSGDSPSEAWCHINYAASQVAAGDTVHIKAGDYGSENVTMSVDGTLDNPIIFEGYTSIPGDNPDLEWSYPDSITFNPAVMPLLNGSDRSTGTGITLNSRRYVIVRNFQIKNYECGLYAWGAENVTVENIIVKDTGDINADYSGNGITFGSEAYYNTLKNCIVLNAAAEGVSVVGDNNSIEGCKVYANDNSTLYKSNTDYYIVVGGNYNSIIDCYAERVGDLDHGGHGIGFKEDCEYNTVTDSTSKNMSGCFYVRHRGSKYNVFTNCVALDPDFGFLIRDGASENIFKKCRVKGGYSAVGFFDTSEDEGAQWAGSDNVFENCIFENTTRMIDFYYYDRNSDTYGNTFVNCNFIGADYLFAVERDNHNNKMVNCIVQNVQNLKTGSFDLNFSYSYTLFHGNGFAAPTGDSILESDPLFVDAGDGDYHLQTGSPCIDAGTAAGAPDTDFDGNPRPQRTGYDIGAYEYPTTYDLTVSDGSGDGDYEEDAEVSISADPPATGYHFVNWTTADGGSFADADSADTTYTMPANNAMVTVHYADGDTPHSADTDNNWSISQSELNTFIGFYDNNDNTITTAHGDITSNRITMREVLRVIYLYNNGGAYIGGQGTVDTYDVDTPQEDPGASPVSVVAKSSKITTPDTGSGVTITVALPERSDGAAKQDNSANNGAGSFRNAIANAAHGDTIIFDGSIEKIILESEILIDKSLNIDGNGVAIVSGDSKTRIFRVYNENEDIFVLLLNMGIIDAENTKDEFGGAIYNNGENLTLENCLLSGNSNSVAGGQGGAIFSSGSLTVNNCVFTSNSAEEENDIYSTNDDVIIE